MSTLFLRLLVHVAAVKVERAVSDDWCWTCVKPRWCCDCGKRCVR